MGNYEKNAANSSQPEQPRICWNWYLESLNNDEDLNDKIQKRLGIFRKRGTPEMDFPDYTVVKYYKICGKEMKHVNKEFFLVKLEKVKMPKAKKRKLLIDYFKQLLGEIDSVTMTEIERAIKDKVYCATAKCGKKYYLYEEFSIYNLPEDDDNEEDEEYDD